MEYRTTHGKVLAKLEKKKHEKERRKTKGKFIVSKYCITSTRTLAIAFLNVIERTSYHNYCTGVHAVDLIQL